jgi:hypothetical protein
MKSFRLSLMNDLGLALAQSLGYAIPPAAVENVGGTFAEPFGDKSVEPGTF